MGRRGPRSNDLGDAVTAPQVGLGQLGLVDGTPIRRSHNQHIFDVGHAEVVIGNFQVN
jgi:hypothetical protein